MSKPAFKIWESGEVTPLLGTPNLEGIKAMIQSTNPQWIWLNDDYGMVYTTNATAALLSGKENIVASAILKRWTTYEMVWGDVLLLPVKELIMLGPPLQGAGA